MGDPTSLPCSIAVSRLHLKEDGALHHTNLGAVLPASTERLTYLSIAPGIKRAETPDLSYENYIALVPVAQHIRFLELRTIYPGSHYLHELLHHLINIEELVMWGSGKDGIKSVLTALQCRLTIFTLESMKSFFDGRLTSDFLVELLDLPSLQELRRLRMSKGLQPSLVGNRRGGWLAACEERGIQVCDRRYFTGTVSLATRPEEIKLTLSLCCRLTSRLRYVLQLSKLLRSSIESALTPQCRFRREERGRSM